MARKIIGVILILTVLAVSIIGYVYYKQRKYTGIDYWRLVPDNSVMVLKSPSFHRLFSKVSVNNVIWQELKSISFFNELNSDGEFIDSLLKNNQLFSDALSNNDVVLSMNLSGKNNPQFLFLLPFNKNVSPQNILHEIQKLKRCDNNKIFDGHEILSIAVNKNRKIYFTLIQNVWVGSSSIVLIEESIRQFDSGLSITNNSELQKIIETSGENTDASIFIKIPDFIKLTEKSLLQEEFKTLLNGSDFMGWLNLDVTIKPNTILLNGFSYSGDSANYYLDLFSDQQPSELNASSIMPENTAWFLHTTFSDFKLWKSKYDKYRLKKAYHVNTITKVDSLNKSFSCDIEEELIGWMGKELVIGAIDQKPDSAAGNVFMLFRPTEEHDAVKRLRQLASYNTDSFNEQYLEYDIHRLLIDSPFYYVLGGTYSLLTKPYFTNIADYIVMTNNVETLKNIINFYHSSRTLIGNLEFRQFSDNISSESNMLFYCAMPHVFSTMQNILNEEFKKDFLNNSEIIKKFQAFSWQLSRSKKSLFYNNIFLKYNPVYKEKKSGLWNLEIENAIIYGPHFFTNHTTNAKDIIIQDELNNLYLISNTGKVFWKKQLDAPVLSAVTEVDMLNNGKVQILLNTSNNIYVIDRNGNFLNGFPVKLPAKATNSVAAIDYEKNRIYRFIIACENNKIYNYDMGGKLVDGWLTPTTESNVFFPLHHFVAGGKDYIVVVENNGKVYALDRKGQLRTSFKNKAGKGGLIYFNIESSVTLENCKINSLDSNGVFYTIYFTDKLDTFQLCNKDIPVSLMYTDINSDKLNEFILFQQGVLRVLNSKNEVVFNHTFPGQAPGKIDIYNFNKAKIISLHYEATSELYMFNTKGELLQGFPIPVQSTYVAGDMNNDRILNVISVSGKTIHAVNAE